MNVADKTIFRSKFRIRVVVFVVLCALFCFSFDYKLRNSKLLSQIIQKNVQGEDG